MKRIKLWFKRNFTVLTYDECRELRLEFYRNVYGDEINYLDCRSIWKDKKGRQYRCESLIANGGGFIMEF